MVNKSYISFYNEIEEIPVKQDINDLEAHYNRRRALYMDLGVPEVLLTNADVLEFGPGSGENAQYIHSLNPTRLVLVDGAAPSINALKEKKQNGLLSNAEIIFSTIEDFTTEKRFDVVLCEGLIPGQSEPEKILKSAASHVKKGGVFVTTTCCNVSFLSEVLRRCLYPILLENAKTKNVDSLEYVVEFFAPHLKSLKFASRFPKDWVLDCIVQPWVKSYAFSVQDAITTLESDYEFYSSNPNFLTDWRWYKTKIKLFNQNNTNAIRKFQNTQPCYISTESEIKEHNADHAKQLAVLCNEVYALHNNIRDSQHVDLSLFKHLRTLVLRISECCGEERVKTYLYDYLSGLNQLLENSTNVDFGSFKSMWGRGQSYVSFIRQTICD